MPCGDRTGPAGIGPRTGRIQGYCAGYTAPGFMNHFGGRGGGRGRRHWYHATGQPGWARAGMGHPAWGGSMYANMSQTEPSAPAMTAEQELNDLKNQAEYFQDALDRTNQRIEQLEAEAKK